MGIDKDKSLLTADAELRRQAEEQLKAKASEAGLSRTDDETVRLLHELQVHRIELEMQNAELRQARDEVEKSLGKYTDLYDFAPVGYLTLDRNGDITAVNLSGTSLLGVERSRLIGRRFELCVTEEFRPSFTAFLDRVFTSLGKEVCELMLVKEDKSSIFVRIEAVDNFSGQECSLAVIDITERKLAESEREQFFTLFRTSADMMCIADPKGNFKKTNPACSEILGYSEQELVGRPFIEFIHADDKQATLDEMRRQLELGYSLNFENRYICKDGSLCWLSWRSVYNKKENITYATARDITKSKQAELTLRESEERYRSIFEQSLDAVFLTMPDGIVVDANPAACKIFGMTAQEFCQVGRAGVIDTNDFRFAPALEERIRTGSINVELTCIRKNGERFPAEISSVIVPGDQPRSFVIVRDITTRKQAEDDLRCYASRLIEMEENLRKKLASELHDEIGRDLTVVGMNLVLISRSMKDDAPKDLIARVADASMLIEAISLSVRCIMGMLRPPVLDDYGLLAALRWHADLFTKRTGIAVTVQAYDPFPRLMIEKEMALFRIAQEALMNASKHAAPTEVTITISRDNGMLRFMIFDNGKGFTPTSFEHFQAGSGCGTKLMRERAELIGGEFHLDSAPGKGTVVSVNLPLGDI